MGATITFVGIGYGVTLLVEARRGEQKTVALLAGDPNIRLRRIRIEYQQRHVVCTDPEVLRYFEERLRAHEPEPKSLGSSYLLSLSFEGGGADEFCAYWDDKDCFNLFIGEPGEGGKGHGIRLGAPRPAAIDELVAFLSKPIGTVAGTVLILEPGGSRIEHDASLVAR